MNCFFFEESGFANEAINHVTNEAAITPLHHPAEVSTSLNLSELNIKCFRGDIAIIDIFDKTYTE